MNFYVMRVNPDTTSNPYTQYPTREEYDEIWTRNQSSGNGFHECVNFREIESNGRKVVTGYVPYSKKTKDLRSNGTKPFVVLTITNAMNRVGMHNHIIGIQAGCINQGKRDALGIADANGPLRKDCPNYLSKLKLSFNYECPAELSLLLSQPIKDAVEKIFGENKAWVQGYGPAIPIPHYAKGEINSGLGGNIFSIIELLDKHIKNNEPFQQEKWSTIKEWIIEHLDQNSNVDNLFNEEENLFELKQKLSKKEDSNEIKTSTSSLRKRSDKMKKFALLRAKGICELCNKKGPFEYKKSFFLEGHHIVPLSREGKNTINNIAALCPNCHKKAHFADISERIKISNKLLTYVDKANKSIKKR